MSIVRALRQLFCLHNVVVDAPIVTAEYIAIRMHCTKCGKDWTELERL